MGVRTYLGSLLSVKKLTHKHVALTALWDNESSFTPYTHILSGAKLHRIKVSKYSRIGVRCKITNTEVGNYSVFSADCVAGVGQHPTNYLSYHSIFYKKGNWGWHDDGVEEDFRFDGEFFPWHQFGHRSASMLFGQGVQDFE